MAIAERLTEDELPVDPDEFESRLIAEIDAFIDAHDLGAPRFDERLTETEMREGLYTRVYNEIMAADVPRDLLDEADRFEDPQIFTHLLKQIQDEAKHARLLAGRLADLDGDPAACFDRANPSPLWDDFESLTASNGRRRCRTRASAWRKRATPTSSATTTTRPPRSTRT